MFHSNIFNNTRGQDRGSGLDIKKLSEKFEDSCVAEDINMDDYNRSCLKDYGPDNILFEYEKPRRDLHQKNRLNLRHHGAYTADMPWRNDDYDMNFHDKDPRGYLEEQDWKKFRGINEKTQKLVPFGKDHDHSITEQGVSPATMVSNLSELRRELRGRLQWFDDSLGNFVVRQGNYNLERPEIIVEDSTVMDPTVLDELGRQNVNRLVSNRANIGGNYFYNTTTTDHVIPVANYAMIFKTNKVFTPRETTSLIIGDHRIKESIRNKNAIMQILDPKAKRVETETEKMRFSRLWELQNTNKSTHVGEILHLLGITETEIRWINSQETKNNFVYTECMKHILDMIDVVQRAPVTVQLELRNQLASSRVHKGGVCDIDATREIKKILENRCVTTRTESELQKNLNKVIKTSGQTQKTQQIMQNTNKTVTDNLTKQAKSDRTRLIAHDQEVEDYNTLWKTKCCVSKNQENSKIVGQIVPDQEQFENTFAGANELKTLNKIKSNLQQLHTPQEHDFEMGRELAPGGDFKSAAQIYHKHVKPKGYEATIEDYVAPNITDFYKNRI